MDEKIKKYMIKFLIMFLAMLWILPKSMVKAEGNDVIRIGEGDRYATAAKAAVTNWTSNDNVVLVSGEGYADAISATVLSKKLNAPILLTTAASLNINSKKALETLKSKNIYVIGGNASVSKEVRDSLRSMYNLIELKGRSRYETNTSVAKELVKLGTTADKIMLVSGEGFSDALSAAVVATAKGQILLLGNNDRDSMKTVIDFIKENSSKTTVIGTSYLINNDIYNEVNGTERIEGGKNRFETNLKILNTFKEDLKGDKLFAANAAGEGYADPLIGVYLGGKYNSPLVLLDREEAENTGNAINYIGDNINSSTEVNVIGGSFVVSDKTISNINDILLKKQSNTVSSVKINGLNQIIVSFNTEVNKSTAETLENYQIDGVNLSSLENNKASVVLQQDERTLVITLENPYPQYKQVILTVKGNILDKDLNANIARFEQRSVFIDLNDPVMQSVDVVGNKKLIVKFSQPIRITENDLREMKINENRITNMGLNTDMTVFGERVGVWTDKVELYFYAPLSNGKNSFKIPKGLSEVRFDNAAGFPMSETSIDFNIDSAADKPQILKIEGSTFTGDIYVTYDRVMDRETALTPANYSINSEVLGSEKLSFLEGSKYRVVKISGANPLLYNGGNEILTVKNIKDAYGNKMDNNTGASFSIPKDNVKPEVSSIKVVNSETIRVKFNKYVNSNYATNKSNYSFINEDGVDISNKIDKVIAVDEANLGSTDTYNIKFTKENALTELKYTLCIKNMIDTNRKPNEMEDYNIVITGIDDISPYVTDIVRKYDNGQKVVVYFSEAMDINTIKNLSNYYFINGEGDTKKLPSTTEVDISEDGKKAIITFPSNYIISDGIDDNHVVKMGILGVKDISGNNLAGIAYCNSISTDYNNGPSIVANTVKAEYAGEDIKIKVLLTSPLDTIFLENFKFAEQTPDSGTMEGNNLVLTFREGIQNNQKLNAIKADSVKALFEISNPTSRDISGKICTPGVETVYRMKLEPKTVPNLWKVNAEAGNNSVSIVFDEDIDDAISGLYEENFIITNARTGGRLKVEQIKVEGKSVIYKFKDGSINVGDSVNVYANSSNNNIRSKKDRFGQYSTYVPSAYDLKNRTIK